MKSCLLFLLAVHFFTSSYAQNLSNEITVDTARAMIQIKFEHSRDTVTVQRLLYPGLYRLTFDKNVNVSNIDIQLQGRKPGETQGFNIQHTKSNTYLEFELTNQETEVSFIANIQSAITYPIQPVIFRMYTAHLKEDISNFTLTDIEGNTYTNQSLLGKVVVFNLWGIRCAPCVKELPQLNSLVNKYKDKENVVFIALSRDYLQELKAFFTRHTFNYKVVGKSEELMRRFTPDSILVVPMHLIIDKEGKLVYRHLGAHLKIEEILSENIDKQLSI